MIKLKSIKEWERVRKDDSHNFANHKSKSDVMTVAKLLGHFSRPYK